MTKNIVKTDKIRKKPADTGQKTIDRLLRKISDLRDKIKTEKVGLDKAMRIYHKEIKPLQIEKLILQKEFVIKTMPFYLNDTKLTEKQRSVLKEILVQQLDQIVQEEQLKDNDELCNIFEILTGETYESVLRKSVDSLKSEMKELFRGMGFDIDLDDIDMYMRREDILKAVAEKIKEHSKTNIYHEKTEESKNTQIEHINESIGIIYKQLAKIFHPDLEQDPGKKEEKENLMKQLTVAYGNNDLAEMFRLETEYLSIEGNNSSCIDKAGIRIYISILKEQVKKFEEEYKALTTGPRYEDLKKYMEDKLDLIRLKQRMQAETYGLQEYIINLRSFLKELDDPIEGLSELKYMIKEYNNKGF